MQKLLLSALLLPASIVMCNEIIPKTFEKFDFGRHSKSIHQLIAAGVVIFLITILMVVSVVLFRFYTLYCRDYRNIRRFQLPMDDNAKTEAHIVNKKSFMCSSLPKESKHNFHSVFYDAVLDV